MYNFKYIQDQWLILSMGGGVLLVLVIILSYIAMWRPRPPGGQERPVRASTDTLRFIPLVLVVIYLVIFVYYFVSPFLWTY